MTQKKTKSIPVFSKEDFIPSGVIDNHEYVDLGLPSGLKWATCNIGASSPEIIGDEFAWGETEVKKRGSDYRFEEERDIEFEDEEDGNFTCSYPFMTKYNSDDEKKTLDPEDDAATANWKGPWRMPTEKEFQELIDNCEWTWGSFNGKNGMRVKGPNGSCIFLSADDCICYDYWSSSLAPITDYDGGEIVDFYDAYCLYIGKEEPYMDEDNNWYKEEDVQDFSRGRKIPIRPVCLINNAN